MPFCIVVFSWLSVMKKHVRSINKHWMHTAVMWQTFNASWCKLSALKKKKTMFNFYTLSWFTWNHPPPKKIVFENFLPISLSANNHANRFRWMINWLTDSILVNTITQKSIYEASWKKDLFVIAYWSLLAMTI